MSEVISGQASGGLSPYVGSAIAVVVGGLGVALSFLGQPELSFRAYWTALILGVAGIGFSRYRLGQSSLSTSGFVTSRGQHRVALLSVALVFVACAANAFVWASEIAKR